ncbi:MAG: hypothetical protein B7X57_10610 [Erythrobacter sp. 34-65-8]|nr:MAG: hypothetical protein B7X57_10610 [Erythrobacter sp. 34-65-8]
MRSFVSWPCPVPGGGTADENALLFDQARQYRVLVVPAFFDEANKLRRQVVAVMDRLDHSGIDSFLPDFPGCNDSLQPLEKQTLAGWRFAAEAAQMHFRATHCLTIRSGALLAPPDLPGWRYAPAGGSQLIRAMMRARTIAAKEAGRDESMAAIEAAGRKAGTELAGWSLGTEMFSSLVDAKLPEAEGLTDIPQGDIGGSGLWLRAEPGEDQSQADALAAIIAVGVLGQ